MRVKCRERLRILHVSSCEIKACKKNPGLNRNRTHDLGNTRQCSTVPTESTGDYWKLCSKW